VDFHASDKILIVHALDIIKVEMRAAAMPQGQIKGTGAGGVCRLGNDSVAIKIPNIVLGD